MVFCQTGCEKISVSVPEYRAHSLGACCPDVETERMFSEMFGRVLTKGP